MNMAVFSGEASDIPVVFVAILLSYHTCRILQKERLSQNMWLNAILWLGIITAAPWLFITLRLNIRPEVYDTGLKYRITVPRFPPLGMSDESTPLRWSLSVVRGGGNLGTIMVKEDSRLPYCQGSS